jgi:hypothetical protein
VVGDDGRITAVYDLANLPAALGMGAAELLSSAGAACGGGGGNGGSDGGDGDGDGGGRGGGGGVVDLTGKLILPGFVDGHAHAPQYAFTGTGERERTRTVRMSLYCRIRSTYFTGTNMWATNQHKSVKEHLQYACTYTVGFAV